jgi:hypothetical protein
MREWVRCGCGASVQCGSKVSKQRERRGEGEGEMKGSPVGFKQVSSPPPLLRNREQSRSKRLCGVVSAREGRGGDRVR